MLKPYSTLFLLLSLPTLALADWQPIDLVPNSLRQQISPACTGAFIDPFVPVAGEQIEYQGNYSEYSVAQQSYLIAGNAMIRQANQQISGDRITFNRLTGIAAISGDYQVREPGFYARGSEVVRDANGAFRASDGRFILHDSQLNGFADQYEQLPNGKLRLRNVRFSRCAPDDPTWRIGSHRLTIDREAGRAQAVSAWVNVYGVPLLWVPYLSIPLNDDRATGLLTPTIKFGGLGTFTPTSVSQPLYLNLAPNYDSTLTWHWYRDIGNRPEAEIRYLTANHQGQIDASRFVANADFGEQHPDLTSRWFWQVNHQGQLTPQLTLQLKAADASDPDWQQDFAFADEAIDSYDQYLRLGWRQGRWQAGLLFDRTEPAKADESLVLADRKYRLWPQLTLGYQQPLPLGLQLSTSNELTRFSKPDLPVLRSQIDNDPIIDRLRNQVSVRSNWGSPALSGSAIVSSSRIQHWLTDAPVDAPAPTSAWVPSINLSQSIKLASEPQWSTQPLRLEFTPTVRYLYVPLVKAQLNNPVVDTQVTSDQYSNPTRLSGGDAIGDLQRLQLTFAHSTLVEGNTRFTASVSQGVKLAQERLQLRGSQFTLAEPDPNWQPRPTGIELKAAWTPVSALELSSQFTFDYQATKNARWLDHNSYALAKRSVALHYSGERQFINLSWLREGTNDDDKFEDELKVSSQIRLSDTLGAVAGASWHNEEGKYDTVALRKVLFGAEWDSCCTHVRVAYQADVAAPVSNDANSNTDEETSPFSSIDDGFFIEVRLKGVAAHNDGIDELLGQFKGYAGRLFQFR